MRMLLVITVLLGAVAAGSAVGGLVDTPECRQALATANRHVEAVAAREKKFVPGDMTTNCRLLRQNLDDMTKAIRPMDRCMTGHDHSENVGQMAASIGDIRQVLAAKCPN
jgi:hypothetical protein